MQEKIYEEVVKALGKHETLNNAVDPELGCAEAWSSIAKRAGVQGIPALGYSGTAALYQFLSTDSQFEEIATPEYGATIISPTVGSKHGHVGFFGKYGVQYVNDWGICSNDSSNGLFREQWHYSAWLDYYQKYLGLTVHIFHTKG